MVKKFAISLFFVFSTLSLSVFSASLEKSTNLLNTASIFSPSFGWFMFYLILLAVMVGVALYLRKPKNNKKKTQINLKNDIHLK